MMGFSCDHFFSVRFCDFGVYGKTELFVFWSQFVAGARGGVRPCSLAEGVVAPRGGGGKMRSPVGERARGGPRFAAETAGGLRPRRARARLRRMERVREGEGYCSVGFVCAFRGGGCVQVE